MRAKIVAAAAVFGLAFTAAAPAADLTLDGKKIGVAVVGTQHFWDREAFNGALDRVRELGGEPVPVDGGRDNQVHASQKTGRYDNRRRCAPQPFSDEGSADRADVELTLSADIVVARTKRDSHANRRDEQWQAPAKHVGEGTVAQKCALED